MHPNIQAAKKILNGHAHVTPVMTSTTLNRMTGAQVYLKCENFQKTGSFKFRGAFNALSRISPKERHRGVVTFSSGNHAQGIALAAGLDLPALPQGDWQTWELPAVAPDDPEGAAQLASAIETRVKALLAEAGAAAV